MTFGQSESFRSSMIDGILMSSLSGSADAETESILEKFHLDSAAARL